MTETAHEVVVLELSPGETIESYGFHPSDILDATDASYERGEGVYHERQDLVRIWVINEVEVEQ